MPTQADQEVKVKLTADSTDVLQKIAEVQSKLTSLQAQQKATQGGWLKGLLAEGDGSPSSSRVMMYAGSVTWYVILILRYLKTGVLPTPAELAIGTAAPSLPYVFNQVSKMTTGKQKGNGNG